jgi:hypothetical protein
LLSERNWFSNRKSNGLLLRFGLLSKIIVVRP